MKNIQANIKTVIVDDHALFRAGLIKLLEAKPEIEIIGEIDLGDKVMEFLDNHQVDLIILDIYLPKVNGLKLLEQIKRKHSKPKILVLSMHKVVEYGRIAIKQGADGYVLKEDAFDQVVQAIDSIMSGKEFISNSLTSAAAEHFFQAEGPLFPEVLTKTEKIVLQHIAEGMSNKEVAKTLDISVRTVETHRAHILKKLKIKNTAGLVQYAIKNKMIKLNRLEE